MDRPRNQPPRQRGPARQTNPSASVPSNQQVIPGVSVSIILKEDQATGQQVQGVVKNLLTRGNHPRGIKVRLQDGRIGRVQQISGRTQTPVTAALAASPAPTSTTPARTSRFQSRDIRLDDEPDMPPPRSLADFMPDSPHIDEAAATRNAAPIDAAVISKCPVCRDFEGDELAVSRHIETHFD